MFIVSIISIVIFEIAILMICANIYELEKEKKIYFVTIGIIVITIFTWIIVNISSIGIQVENKEYLFAPINAILALPYLGNIINKLKQDSLTKGQVKFKILVLLAILVIIAIIEVSYIKNFQIGMLSNAIK